MPWFRRKGKVATRPEVIKDSEDARSIQSTIANDLFGVDDFKRSKIGFLTGFSAARKAFTSVSSSVGDTFGRTKYLFASVWEGEKSIPSLDDTASAQEASEKFLKAMQLHRLGGNDLQRILRNTRRVGYVYLFFTFLCLVAALVSSYYWPPPGPLTAIFRLGPAPLTIALVLKHFYTNWMVRNKRLAPISDYLKSWDWLPKA
jgi:hypothetical protein